MIGLILINAKGKIKGHFSERTALDLIKRWKEVSKIESINEYLFRYWGQTDYIVSTIDDAYFHVRKLANDERNRYFKIEEYDRFGQTMYSSDTTLTGIQEELTNKFEYWSSNQFTARATETRLSLRLVNSHGHVVATNFDNIAEWVCDALQIPNIFKELPRVVKPKPENQTTKITIDVLDVVNEIYQLSSVPGNEVRIHELSAVLKYSMENKSPEVITAVPGEIPKVSHYIIEYIEGSTFAKKSIHALNSEQAVNLFHTLTGIDRSLIQTVSEVK